MLSLAKLDMYRQKYTTPLCIIFVQIRNLYGKCQSKLHNFDLCLVTKIFAILQQCLTILFANAKSVSVAERLS